MVAGDRVVRIRLRRIAQPEPRLSRLERRRSIESEVWLRALGWLVIGISGGLIMAVSWWLLRVWLILGVWAVSIGLVAPR